MLETDSWLGGALGLDALRLTFPAGSPSIRSDRKSPPTREAVFIYTKIDVQDLEKAKFLERLGFRLVDTNLTFEKALDPEAVKSMETGGREVPVIRMAEAGDEAPAVGLARRSFRNSRFHIDAGIPAGAADRMKGEWVRNYFLGARGDAMVVAGSGNGVAGFLLLLKSDTALTIDLVAVDQVHRGKALAGSMTRFAESRYPEIPLVRVGTQIANAPAIRCYQKMGFALARSQYVFHYHGVLPPALAD